MKTVTLLIPLGLVFALFVAIALRASPPPAVIQETAILAPSEAMATIPMIRSLPSATTRGNATPTPSPVARNRASLPTQKPATLPDRPLPTPTPTPTPMPMPTAAAANRVNCDPAYPEQRTCIPPGPPFNQGCAITDQRLFVVLTPDPQRLDSDKDGIGCEPMSGRS
jgi:hypothetical protein